MDLLAFLPLHAAALLAQHCLLLPDLQQQLAQLPVLLEVLAQPVVLVLQGRAVRKQDHGLGQGLRSDGQHFVVG